MQMTGYMFKNAEYRQSLKQSLEKSAALLPGEAPAAQIASSVTGKISVDMGGQKVEVNAAAFVADLHAEVAQLKSALARVQAVPTEGGGQGALLSYMATLPREQLQTLSSDISSDVLECMEMLIETVLARDAGGLGGATVVEGTGMKMRELLVWQLIIGYKLRELEQRDQLNKLMAK
mmetsp:Transcript_18323/g.46860  ORF Transcript_18323/g.46860 Transcript_18323/m.46860 type:complete len:177 (-) Transcript_18323:147-677(-)